jgi:ubiquinone/menaquinone biosynthesis C-methylase UbiE
MGENTLPLVQLSSNIVCSTDISSKSIEVMNKKFSKYKNFSSQIVDMEKLPFKSQSFDIICSAGSLAYGDNNAVMNECYRVIKRGGYMIVVDSLNHNPIYRLNRYLNYLLGKRTKNVLKRIPNNNLINRYIKKFGYGKVKFFGSITWTFPLLKILLDEKIITKISNWIDQILKVKKSAFKFVLILNKRK